MAVTHFVAGRYEVALEWTSKALNENPNFFPPLRTRAACLGHLGRLEEGRQIVARILAVRPDETIERAGRRLALRRPEHVQTLFDGLRKAGLPE